MARLLTRQRMRRNRRKGTAPEYPRVRNLANALCTLPPGFGMSSKAIPSNTAVVAMVTMMGARRPFVTRTPFTAPQARPTAAAAPRAGTNPQAESGFMDMTQTTLHRATIPPRDKSIPPVRMISVCPRAAMSSGKEERRRFLKFPRVKKVLIKYAYKNHESCQKHVYDNRMPVFMPEVSIQSALHPFSPSFLFFPSPMPSCIIRSSVSSSFPGHRISCPRT